MDNESALSEEQANFDPTQITRPDPSLMTYYFIVAVLTTIGFFFLILPLVFKYHTLRYKFDDKGVSMSWGVLFRREIYLTYRRIQDIHVTRNIFQRWLGLAEVAVQTASGSAGAEMKIEGIRRPELLRDFLYRQMRGARGETEPQVAGEAAGEPVSDSDEALALLQGIRDDLRGLRQTMEARS
ncbi:MAG: PH domain-containing protein [Phycisphaerales bacterium]|nr:MAG: PH domain-containing protein [Phycisphaerales bacterium]